MKFRSLLLVTCMLVVPALAMFSHKIPAEIRATVRRNLREGLSAWLGRPAEASGPAQPLQATRPHEPPVAAGVTPPTTAVAAGPEGSASTLRPVDVPAAPPPPPLVARMADRSRQARDQQAIESRLKDLGAVSFDSQPLGGDAGLHSSSCRVPVDSSGQLQRVFQATDVDPVAASEQLLQQVVEWRRRAAAPVPATITAGGLEQMPATRLR